MCQGKVSDAWQNKIKESAPDKYELIKNNLEESMNHPSEDDIKSLIMELDKLSL